MIPFCRQYLVGTEENEIANALKNRSIAAPGPYSELCEALISDQVGKAPALLVPSCTAALEMAAILLNLQPGDEVIMPSFTFSTTATSVVLRGARPVFVDVDPNTFNLDPEAVARAIGPNTRAIFVVHYAGVPADMESLLLIAREHGIKLVEDAAQAYGSYYNGQPAGSHGHLSCFSFHGTKNISSGEGGALVINDSDLLERAEIIREKGTDRAKFLTGQTAFYTWQDIGSSMVVNEMTAAFLSVQLRAAAHITERRLEQWHRYKAALAEPAAQGHFSLPDPPRNCKHNAHCFFVVLPSREIRADLMQHLRDFGISAVSHYVPLHSSPAGQRFGRQVGPMPNTQRAADCLLRLPLWHDLGSDQEVVIEAISDWCSKEGSRNAYAQIGQ